MEQAQIEQIQNLENQSNQSKKANKKLLFLLVVLALILVSAGGVFLFKDKIFPSEIEDKELAVDYLIEVKTDKAIYNQGESIRFTVINKGEKPVWFIAPPKRCEKDFYWSVMEKEQDTSWHNKPLWPRCDVNESDLDFIVIKKLNSQESVSSAWNQKVLNKDESYYAEQGSYKVLFYYFENEITNDSIKKSSSNDSKDAYSNEFRIKVGDYDPNNFSKENDAKRKSDLSEIKVLLELYYDDNGEYPISNELTKLNENSSVSVRQFILQYVARSSISILKDSKDPEFYYGYKSDGNYYELSARLENLEDEECELLNSDLCIYKIDSKGNVSKKIK